MASTPSISHFIVRSLPVAVSPEVYRSLLLKMGPSSAQGRIDFVDNSPNSGECNPGLSKAGVPILAESPSGHISMLLFTCFVSNYVDSRVTLW